MADKSKAYFAEQALDALREVEQNAHQGCWTLVEKKQTKDGCYPFIPYSLDLFLRYCEAVSDLREIIAPGEPTKFLEVGCGVGVKLLLARRWFQETDGIDIHRRHLKAAKLLNPASKIVNVDARKWKKYSNYDVIYFWCPLMNDKDEREMEKWIFNQCKMGTIFIAMGQMGYVLKGSVEFPNLHSLRSPIGIKTDDAALVEKLKLKVKVAS